MVDNVLDEGNGATENRSSRKTETREASQRKRSWKRPELLPTPEPSDGFTYRWIRVSMLGNADPTNYSSKTREGWEPVKRHEHQEIALAADDNERFKDNIVIGGLMLCKAPVELVEERNAFYQSQNEAQMRSVDNNLMRENDPRMPLYNDRKSKVTFGTGH